MKNIRNRFISLWAAALLNILTRLPNKKDLNRRMNRMEFRNSARRMGVRFLETLRKSWRARWLKIRRP
ncbi:MAG: hypothetical protein IID32_01745 [Planctomycetes bacterium]|nr:hypothetical protein [Planctomycetota bacterium]